MSVSLKTGSSITVLVYRVVEDEPVGEGKHTWKTAAIAVERASARQIKLARPLPGHGGSVFKPTDLGRLFFESPLQAIKHFLIARQLEIDSFDRKRKEAERAIAWAKSQEGIAP